MTAAELAASRAETERLRKRVASLSEENASLQEAVQLVAAAQKEVTVRNLPQKRQPGHGNAEFVAHGPSTRNASLHFRKPDR